MSDTASTPAYRGLQINGLHIAYLDSAPDDRQARVVVLLHGFPDNATLWRPQIEALAARGFRVIAPDLRGYGQSDVPPRQSDFLVDHVVSDIIGLLDALHVDAVDLAGHDWGAAVAWVLAGQHPDRVRRLAVMAVGHPTVYARAGLAQKIKGWYVFLFLARGLAERVIRAGDWEGLRRVFGTHPHVDQAIADLDREGRLTAALRLYRANFRRLLLQPVPDVHADTLGVFATGDPFLTADQMRDSFARVRGRWRYVELPGGHWSSLEHPEAINDLLIGHFWPH